MNKKILSIVLAMLMLFTIVPLAISGADDNAVRIVETGTEYSTFKAAFSAVEDGQTIRFLKNVEESGYLGKSGLKNCTITIDFNGYYYAEKNQRWLSFDSSTTGFTINFKNGTLKSYESNADLRGFVCLRSGCTYNFTNMVIDCSPKGKHYGGGTVAMAIVADATVNFRNCTITDNGVGTPAGGLVYYNAWTNATVNYYNTNVTSYTALFNNKGTTLYSGTFEAVGSLNIGTYTVASTSTATTAESKKVVVECNHNYTDGYCDYCGANVGGDNPTEATVTTKETATTAAATTTTAESSSNTYVSQRSLTDGEKYYIILPSSKESKNLKGLMLTNESVNDSNVGTTLNTTVISEYDTSLINTSKECNALESFVMKTDYSQYLWTAEKNTVDNTDYWAFKDINGKYICVQITKGSATWNPVSVVDTKTDDCLFNLGEFRTGKTGEASGNNAFMPKSKNSAHLRIMNSGAACCKSDADWYQSSVAFYRIGTVEPTVPASSATTAATTAVTTAATTAPVVTDTKTFVFLKGNSSTSDFTIDTNGHAYNFFNDYNNTGMQISGLVAGQTLTFTSKDSLDSGIYSPTLYCRSLGVRAKVNVFINDIQVATALDTGVSNGSHKPFTLDSVTIDKAGPVTIKFVTTSSGSFFPDDIVFEKTGDADPFAVSVSMQKGASIRLSSTNGIRFYTKVDSSKIASLIADGYTVEMGTLITPADLLGANELTLETDVKKLNVAYEAKDSSGNFIYYENGDTFVGSIYDIKEASTSWSVSSGNITRDFVARGYVKVSKDGKEKVNYADYYNNDVQNNSRSLQYVANAYKNDSNSNYASLEDTFKGFVDKWASAVK